jgi:hypothetical protein
MAAMGALQAAGDAELGVTLALASAVCIGFAFIAKKRGLRLAATSSFARASANGFSYLRQPLWWVGFLTSASQT